jgi:uncharacterized protein
MSDVSEQVTLVVTRRVRPGREADYEAWLARLLDATHGLPGYLGCTIQRPVPDGVREYVCIYKFDGVDSLRAFERSDARRTALAQLGDFVEADAVFRTATGLELWFTPPTGTVVATATRWRMAVLMIVVIYALVLVLGRGVNFVLDGQSFELRLAVTISIEVTLMTYWVMPLLTRKLARWIYPRARETASG